MVDLGRGRRGAVNRSTLKQMWNDGVATMLTNGERPRYGKGTIRWFEYDCDWERRLRQGTDNGVIRVSGGVGMEGDWREGRDSEKGREVQEQVGSDGVMSGTCPEGHWVRKRVARMERERSKETVRGRRNLRIYGFTNGCFHSEFNLHNHFETHMYDFTILSMQ